MSTKVAIIGCGIAGPVLAMFLKVKGYDPIIYERFDEPAIVGLSIALQVNGLKVLKLLPDVFANLPGNMLEGLSFVSLTLKEGLATSDLPSRMPERFGEGVGLRGVQRDALLRHLCSSAESYGIPIKWGHMLTDLEDLGSEVEVRFSNGVKEKASFVVGCDGLHSNTRICLFGDEKPSFTGLVQTGGLSPTPDILKVKKNLSGYFGIGAHMITYPTSDTHSSWAITTHEAERRESWRAIDEDAKQAFKEGPFSNWCLGAGDLVRNAVKVIKYGLYDRPSLSTWHKGRIVLLGDAAHPTSPHIGQGANQALEDVYHLVRTLLKHHKDRQANPTTEELAAAFKEYEGVRIERTSAFVKFAHEKGHVRVVLTEEDALKRDNAIREKWDDVVDGWSEFDRFSREPYDKVSDI